MPTTSRLLRAVGPIAAASLLVAACGDDPDTTGDTSSATVEDPTESATPANDVVADTTAPDTAGPVDTDAATDTAAPTDTGAALPANRRDELVLRSNGLGDVDFGRPDIEVIPYITARLGQPTTDQLGEYPTFDDEFDAYVNFDDDGFSRPFGRTTCYDNRFCVFFGGDSSDALSFVGWSQEGFDLRSDPLSTADGITVGSRASDHVGVMTVDQGGCFTTGTGEAAGVLLYVASEGEPFETVDEDGNFVQGNPDPSEVVVQGLEAGDRPFFLFADC